MKVRRNKRFHAEVATASLNDIMFFLMLFFLIVSTLANPNVIKIMLPKADATESVQKQPITLTVNEKKEYFINTTPVAAANLEVEIQKLLAASTDNKDATIVLRLAKNLTVQDLVDVMKLGIKLKLKIVLATEKGV
ncbi:MAG: ExbD/TolR family protein [Bacteroidia bacterium]